MAFAVVIIVGLLLGVLMSDYWVTSSRHILFKILCCIVCAISWITLTIMIMD